MGEKDTFQVGIARQLHEWNIQLEGTLQTVANLKEKAAKLEPSAQYEYLDHIQEIESKIIATKAKIDEGQHRLESMKAAGEEAWEELKSGSQQAWSDLSVGVNEAWDAMKISVEQASSKIEEGIPKK